MTAEQQVDQLRWPRPPEGGYTVDDLFTLPDLPPHTELIDGGLVFMAPQQNFHSLMNTVLETALRHAAPDDLRVRREMLVVLSDGTAVEPDILAVQRSAVEAPEQSTYRPADLVLAVEVVSPSSRERDYDTKPHKYAGAGIPYFWRVERVGDRIIAQTFVLDANVARYRRTGTFMSELRASQPFDIHVDLTEADRL